MFISENNQFPSETRSYKIQHLDFLPIYTGIVNSDLVLPASATVVSLFCVRLHRFWPLLTAVYRLSNKVIFPHK